MEIQRTVVLEYEVNPEFSYLATENGKIPYEILKALLSMKIHPDGRLLLALKQFLEQKFEKVDIVTTFLNNDLLSNGIRSGVIDQNNRSKVDIGIQSVMINEKTSLRADFSYPYELSDYTFITEPPEYVPHMFGIFQTFNVTVWLTLAIFLIALVILYYFILKRKFHLSQVLVHILAVLMKQSALLIPSSLAEKILLYSWVAGAMILCLSYESVILSFLSFPPVTKIEHLSDLAFATEKGAISCIGVPSNVIHAEMMKTNRKDLKPIADSVLETRSRLVPLMDNFLQGEKRTNLALLTETFVSEICAKNNFFVSEDRFFTAMAGMPMRKEFCCKKLIDTFVHRIVASGIYYKYFEEYSFQLSRRVKYFGNELPQRKLTLTDVAPALIVLLCGYFIALVAFVYEVVSYRKNLQHLNLTIRKFKISNLI